MANLTVGMKFTEEHVNTLLSIVDDPLNDVNRVDSIYTNVSCINPFGSVRETYRDATDVNDGLAEELLNRIVEAGINIHLTMNSLFNAPGTSPLNSGRMIEDLCDFMEEGGEFFDRFIIAHPGLVDIFLEHFPQKKVIISTIMNVHNLPQMQWIKDNWPNVVRVCPAIEKNRDYWWLKEANSIIPLELLANEFCSMGGVVCEGLYRQACYHHQSMDDTVWCARDKCESLRKNNAVAWLCSRVILPQWFTLYEEVCGIDYFKITGRTHPPEFLRSITETYKSGKADGNLLALWGQLDATKMKVDQVAEQIKSISSLYIPIDLVDDKKYYGTCSNDLCNLKCKRCSELSEANNGFKTIPGSD